MERRSRSTGKSSPSCTTGPMRISRNHHGNRDRGPWLRGTTMPIHGIDSIPIDAGSLRLPKKDTRVSSSIKLARRDAQPAHHRGSGADVRHRPQDRGLDSERGGHPRYDRRCGDRCEGCEDRQTVRREAHAVDVWGRRERGGRKAVSAHMQALLEKAKQHDAKAAAQGFTISDVTPEGYGPTGPTEGSHDPNAFEHDTRVHKLQCDQRGRDAASGQGQGDKGRRSRLRWQRNGRS